jgi:hypothetical protein
MVDTVIARSYFPPISCCRTNFFEFKDLSSMKLFLLGLFIFISTSGYTQSRLVINGGIITIANGAVLVIDNGDNLAISQTGSGYIVSEGAENRVSWSIGSGNNNNYLIPFGNAIDYLPLSFEAAAGTSDGNFIFSTYPTPTWKNSDDLPTGVTNVNHGPTDNSAYIIDRFWQIRPQNYGTTPTLQNLIFTYTTKELNPPNTINENSLIAERWNNIANSWSDYVPASTIDVANKKLKVLNIPGNELYDWWTMADASSPLPVTLMNFSAKVKDAFVEIHWQTALETNSSYFEIWKSKSLTQFELVGKVAAAGASSTLQNYSLTDFKPYSGESYYKLKEVDLDGKFIWSPLVQVEFKEKDLVFIFPNPADSYIILTFYANSLDLKTVAQIYDASGRLVQSFNIEDWHQKIDVSTLARGIYHIYFLYHHNQIQLDFIKL